jgi:transcription-repair coupling factor (superfamily II helicase)
VKFKDLGLLVIDEEHRFGVKQKSRFQKLRESLDILSMSATPIPRTLEMGLTGMRTMSLMQTPPRDRLSVHTTLARMSEARVRDAILGERERGGQVFFVHNRVDTIYAVADELRRMVPEARIGVGHAQLRDEELEQVMMDFINRRLDVLVSTTIVESGIDISTANTMFINNADKFGLSQLHQLRGRVGRGQDRAFCYLLVGDPNRLPPDAKRRLDVLLEHSELGSGLVVAQQDLDMRGAGNILGSDQSGHIEAVGFELYAELLEEAVRELQGKPKEAEVEPEVKIPAVAFVPEDYVADIGQRLTLYKRLSLAADDAAVYDIVAEMQDRYGPLPESVEHLRDVVLVKQIMKRIRAKQIEAGPKAVVVELLPETRLVPQKVLDLIKVHRGAYEMRPNLVIVRKLDPRDGIPVLSSALTVARELAACVGS